MCLVWVNACASFGLIFLLWLLPLCCSVAPYTLRRIYRWPYMVPQVGAAARRLLSLPSLCRRLLSRHRRRLRHCRRRPTRVQPAAAATMSCCPDLLLPMAATAADDDDDDPRRRLASSPTAHADAAAAAIARRALRRLPHPCFCCSATFAACAHEDARPSPAASRCRTMKS